MATKKELSQNDLENIIELLSIERFVNRERVKQYIKYYITDILEEKLLDYNIGLAFDKIMEMTNN